MESATCDAVTTTAVDVVGTVAALARPEVSGAIGATTIVAAGAARWTAGDGTTVEGVTAVAVPRDIGAAMGAPGRGAGLGTDATGDCGRGTDDTEDCGRNTAPDRGNGRDAGTAARGIAMREAAGEPGVTIGRLGAGAARGGGAALIAERGNGTIGNCAACAARSAGITCACGAALVVAGVDDGQGELGASAPGQGAPAGHALPGHAPPGADPLPLELAELGDPGLGAWPRIMSIHRCSFSLTATSRRWTAMSITVSMGTPALSAVAMVWTCVCSGDAAAGGAATGSTGETNGGDIAGPAIGGIVVAGIGGTALLTREPSSAATSVRAASRPAARLSGVASSLMATRIESSSESMEPPRRRAARSIAGFQNGGGSSWPTSSASSTWPLMLSRGEYLRMRRASSSMASSGATTRVATSTESRS